MVQENHTEHTESFILKEYKEQEFLSLVSPDNFQKFAAIRDQLPELTFSLVLKSNDNGSTYWGTESNLWAASSSVSSGFSGWQTADDALNGFIEQIGFVGVKQGIALNVRVADRTCSFHTSGDMANGYVFEPAPHPTPQEGFLRRLMNGARKALDLAA